MSEAARAAEQDLDDMEDTGEMPPILQGVQHTQPQQLPEAAVGRLVHYRSRGSTDGAFPPACRASIITEVTPACGVCSTERADPTPELASLAVLNPTGMFFDQDLPHDPTGGDRPGSWHWYTECKEWSQ